MYLTVNDTTLYVDVDGEGLVPDGPVLRTRPTLLLLHGGPGFDHAYFKPALSPLRDTVQLLYLDQRGQGRSGRPPLDTCTVEHMADDAAAVCRTLGILRPLVLGHSFGGFVALQLALRHPGVVGGLILVDSAASLVHVGDSLALLGERHGAETRLAAARVFGGECSAAAMAAFDRLVGPAYFCDAPQAGWFLEALGRTSFTPAVLSHFNRYGAAVYDVRARLGEIHVPVLVVVGDHDWITPPSAGRVLASGIAGAELLVVPACGHFPFGEQPAIFLGAVRRFLAAQPAGEV